jgi:hypothetical protein
VISIEPGGDGVVIEGSATEDTSGLLAGGASSTETRIKSGGAIISVGGFGTAGGGVISSLASGKIEGFHWVTWKVGLSVTFTIQSISIDRYHLLMPTGQ